MMKLFIIGTVLNILSVFIYAFGVEVVTDPYRFVNYDEIEVYDYTKKEDNCECNW